MQLIPIKSSDFDYIYEEMVKNFIKAELRDYDDAKALVDNGRYTVYHIELNSERIGFITVWELDSFTFFEHFVIFEKHRNKGYGKMALDLLKKRFPITVLEAEPPDTELSARRIGFYGRAGYSINDFPYIQPPYRASDTGIPLLLLSYPHALIDIDNVIKEIYTQVYNVK